jgi:hypothetical protein
VGTRVMEGWCNFHVLCHGRFIWLMFNIKNNLFHTMINVVTVLENKVYSVKHKVLLWWGSSLTHAKPKRTKEVIILEFWSVLISIPAMFLHFHILHGKHNTWTKLRIMYRHITHSIRKYTEWNNLRSSFTDYVHKELITCHPSWMTIMNFAQSLSTTIT